MGSNESTMLTKKFKTPKNAVSDFEILNKPKVSIDYIDVDEARDSLLEPTNWNSQPFSSSSGLKKSTSQQLRIVSSEYMDPWDSIPGKTIHTAVNVVNSQPIKKQDYFEDEFLSECCWYLGEINRREAEKFLTSQPLYSFLVRKKGESEYTISLKYQFGYIHMMIAKENGKFTLGSCKAKSFLSLLDMINHYQRFPMDIEGVGKIQLKLPKFS